MTPTRYVVPLPWQTPPLSMNDRYGWQKASSVRRDIRTAMRMLAQAHQLPEHAAYVRVQLQYQPPDKRRRDTDNLTATLKPLCDALAGEKRDATTWPLVPDDTPEFMAKPEPIIHTKRARKPGRMWLTIDVYDDCQYPY